MARVEGGAVIIDTDWTGLKYQIDTRNVNFKYEEDNTAYQIFAIDGQYFYQTVIYKSGQAPQDQASHDTWRAEFEADYKNKVTDFSSTQPFYLSNVDGYSVVLKNGAAPTANDGYGVAVIASDGSNYRMLRSDTSGRPVLVGAGVAGTPAGGILTIQGDPSGTPLPISGNITASNASVDDNDQAIPAFSNLIGGSDGTNLRPLRVFDVDTGGGQEWVLGVGLRKASGGGSVEFGTSTDPVRTDPTGTTTQPVSGTITANQGGSWTVAATQSGTWTVQPGNTANTTPWLTTINQGGNSATVTASNALKVDGSAVTQPVSGTVTANAGTGDFTVVQATASNLNAQVVGNVASGNALAGNPVRIGASDGTNVRNIFSDTSGRLFVVGGAASGAAVSGNPVLIAGSDGTNARSILTATDGTVRIDPTGTTTQPVSGTVAATQSGTWTVQPGNTANTTPWLTTINQGGNSAIVTASNALKVDGSAVTQPISGTVTANQGTSPWVTNVSQFGGNNVVTGTGISGSGIPRVTVSNDSNILATQSGTWTVQQGTPPWSVAGTAADGAAVSGNPVRIGGSDGTNTQDIITDTTGRQIMVGAAADGAAVTGNPVLMGGQDGTNAQSILTDTAGRQVMVGAAADGATVTGNPILIGGTDGTNAQTVELRNTHPVGDVQGIIVRNIETSFPTFHAVFDRISPAANKYMATLWNGASGRKVVVQRIWRFNWQVATVTGTNLDQEVRRITARTSGTSVTPLALDSNDTLTSGITADHNSTSVTDSSLLQRIAAVSEERDILDTRVVDWLSLYPFALIYDRKEGTRGIVLRENQGLSIKNITSSTVGTVSYIIEFTDEVA